MDTSPSFSPYTHTHSNFPLPPNSSTPRHDTLDSPTPISTQQPFVVDSSILFTSSRLPTTSGLPALSQSQGADFRLSASHLQPEEPHASCIMQATDHHLARYQNAPYVLLRQQVDNLRRRVFELETENRVYKQNYDDIIVRLPQLVGMEPDESIKTQLPATFSHGRIVLGLGWEFPKPLKPDGATLKWWESGRWKEEKNQGGGKPGQHDEGLNMAQHFLEDKNGETVSGYVAKDVRNRLRACIHSLMWSGQATPTESNLGHEARAYIHVMMARAFDFLRYCDNGTWKTDALLKQMYHSVVKSFAIEGPVPKKRKKSSKADTANKRAKSDTPASGASDTTTPVPASPPISVSPAPSALIPPPSLPSSCQSVQLPFEPLSIPSPHTAPLPPTLPEPASLPPPTFPTSFEFAQPLSPSLAPTSLLSTSIVPHPPWTSPSPLLPTASSSLPSSSPSSPAATTNSMIPPPPSSSSPSPTLPPVSPGPTSSSAAPPPILPDQSLEMPKTQPSHGPPKPRPIVPVKAPFANLRMPQQSAGSRELQPTTEALEPTSSLPDGQPPSVMNAAHTSSDGSASLPSEEGAGSEAAPKAANKPARRRMPKDHEPARLAYMEGIASEQNLYLKRLLDADPGLSMTHAQFKQAFAQLSGDILKELKEATRDARRAKRAKPVAV